jgi:hypothetical protein
MKVPKNYSLYESSYANEFPIEQLYLTNFESVPSRYSDLLEYSNEIFKYF